MERRGGGQWCGDGYADVRENGSREKGEGGGGLGDGPPRGEGEGGSGSERDESKSSLTGRVHAVEAVVAERIVGSGVDVTWVTRAVRKSPNNTSFPHADPSVLDVAVPRALSGSANITLQHGTSDRGRRLAYA